MAHDIHIDSTRPVVQAGSVKITLIAALAVAVAVFSLVDVSAPSRSQTDGVVQSDEDWHGNVRRSNWPN